MIVETKKIALRSGNQMVAEGAIKGNKPARSLRPGRFAINYFVCEEL